MLVGFGNTFHARNTIVHRDNAIGARVPLRHLFDNIRGKAIPMNESVGHHEIDVGPESLHGPHANGARRSTIRVVIGHNKEALPLFHLVRNQLRHALGICQFLNADGLSKVIDQRFGGINTPSRQDACHSRRTALLDEILNGVRWDNAWSKTRLSG